MANKRESPFGHTRPDDGFQYGGDLNTPADTAQRATAAQMAGRRIAGSKRGRARTPGTSSAPPNPVNFFGAQQPAMSFPQPSQTATQPNTSVTASFPPASGGFNFDKPNAFNFSGPSGTFNNPFASNTDGKENQTPSLNGTSNMFANSTPAASTPQFNFGGVNTNATANTFSFSSNAATQGTPAAPTPTNFFGQSTTTQTPLFGNSSTTSNAQNNAPGSLFGSTAVGFGGQPTNPASNGFGQSSTLFGSQPSNQALPTPSSQPFSNNHDSANGATTSLFKFGTTTETSHPTQTKPAFSFPSSISTSQPAISTPAKTTTPSPTEDAMHTSPEFHRLAKAADTSNGVPTSNGDTSAGAPTSGFGGSVFGKSLQQDTPKATTSVADAASGLLTTTAGIGAPAAAANPAAPNPFSSSATSSFNTPQTANKPFGTLFGQPKTSDAEQGPTAQQPAEPPKFGGGLQSATPTTDIFSKPIDQGTTEKSAPTFAGFSGFGKSVASDSTPKPLSESSTTSSNSMTFANGGTPTSTSAKPPISAFPSSSGAAPTPSKPTELFGAGAGLPKKDETASSTPKTINGTDIDPQPPAHFNELQQRRFKQNFRFVRLNQQFKELLEAEKKYVDLSEIAQWYQECAAIINAGQEPDIASKASSTPAVIKRPAAEPASETVLESAAKRVRTGSGTAAAASQPLFANSSAPAGDLFGTRSTPNATSISTGSPVKKRTHDVGNETPSTSRGSLFQSSTPATVKQNPATEDSRASDLVGSTSKRARVSENGATDFMLNSLSKKDPPTEKKVSPPVQSTFANSKSASPTPSTSGGTSVFDDPTHKTQSFTGNLFGHLNQSQGGSDKENEEATDESDADGETEEADKSKTSESDTQQGKNEQQNPFAAFSNRTSASPAPSAANSASSSVFKPASSLFGRIKTSKDGTPEREVPEETTEKVESITETKKNSLFGASAGDFTFKHNSPIKFGDSVSQSGSKESEPNGTSDTSKSSEGTKNFSFSVTPATPNAAASAFSGSLFNTPKPSSGLGQSSVTGSLFGNLGSTTPSGSPAKPFTFGDTSATPKPSASLFNFSPLPSAATSRASTPALSVADTSAPESSAAEGDGKEAEEHSNLPQTSLTDLTAEERENEEVLYEDLKVKAKLNVKGPDGKPTFDIKGTGPIRVLKHKTTGAVRVLMRLSPNGKVILNARIPKGITGQVLKPKLALLPFAEDSKIVPWYIQTATPEAANALVKAYNENQG